VLRTIGDDLICSQRNAGFRCGLGERAQNLRLVRASRRV
jgi:hypothetical protein